MSCEPRYGALIRNSSATRPNFDLIRKDENWGRTWAAGLDADSDGYRAGFDPATIERTHSADIVTIVGASHDVHHQLVELGLFSSQMGQSEGQRSPVARQPVGDHHRGRPILAVLRRAARCRNRTARAREAALASARA
jgi:hypothetical protein